jgi:Domain of unknown function (DUF4288)
MQQYLAKLIFNINIENGQETSDFDEQIRLIESNNLESAFQKARSVGKKEETSFFNHENKMVSWQFIDVIELFPLQNFKDEEHLFAITHEQQHTDTYINYIREKSMMIQLKNVAFV